MKKEEKNFRDGEIIIYIFLTSLMFKFIQEGKNKGREDPKKVSFKMYKRWKIFRKYKKL